MRPLATRTRRRLWGRPLIVTSLLAALQGQSGVIIVLDLGRYVSKRVPVLTEQKQEPLLIMPAGGVPDFAIAR